MVIIEKRPNPGISRLFWSLVKKGHTHTHIWDNIQVDSGFLAKGTV